MEETSLVVQWLRLHLPIQGVQFQSLGEEPRSHMPLGQYIYMCIYIYTHIYIRSNTETNSIKILKMVHIKIKSLKFFLVKKIIKILHR